METSQSHSALYYKNGSKDKINNYRPISILPTLSKLVENFIQKNFLSLFNEFDVIYHVSLKKLMQHKVFVIQNFMEIWYINLRKSLEIQTSLIF